MCLSLASIKLGANSDFGARSRARRKALSYVYSSPRLCIESPAPARADKVPTLWLEIEPDRNIKSNLSPLPNAQSQTIIRTILRAKLFQTLMQLSHPFVHYRFFQTKWYKKRKLFSPFAKFIWIFFIILGCEIFTNSRYTIWYSNILKYSGPRLFFEKSLNSNIFND